MVSIGLNVKYALWKLAGDDATSFGFDAGIMVEPIDRFTASFVSEGHKQPLFMEEHAVGEICRFARWPVSGEGR